MHILQLRLSVVNNKNEMFRDTHSLILITGFHCNAFRNVNGSSIEDLFALTAKELSLKCNMRDTAKSLKEAKTSTGV